jgi:hypothetical protein
LDELLEKLDLGGMCLASVNFLAFGTSGLAIDKKYYSQGNSPQS